MIASNLTPQEALFWLVVLAITSTLGWIGMNWKDRRIK